MVNQTKARPASREIQTQKLSATVADPARKVGRPPGKRRSQRKGLRKAIPTVVASPFMTTLEAAQYLSLSRQFLEGARCRGDGSGPAYVRFGTAVRYRRSVLDAWVSANEHSADEAFVAPRKRPVPAKTRKAKLAPSAITTPA